MAEAFGVAAGALTVIELTSKLIRQCKHLIETTRDAPQDLNRVLVEIASLKAALESLHYLSSAGCDLPGNVRTLDSTEGALKGCADAVSQLATELDGLALGSQSPPTKRQKVEGSLKWCFKESRARKILDDILQHKTTIVLTLLGDVTQDVNEIKKDVRVVRETGTALDRRMICDWLELTNPTHDHNLACKLHEQQTCEWILKFDGWNKWLSFSSLRNIDRFLWVHGIPGSGKTVLASYIVTRIEDHCSKIPGPRELHPCLYYYCSYRHHQDEALPFLIWVTTQLCRYLGRVPGIIADRHHLRKEITIADLKIAIRTLLDDVDVVYIVLDAVDESDPRDNLLAVLVTLSQQVEFSKIRLLATSRDYVDIEKALKPISVSIPMSNPLIDVDIRQYVSVALQENRRLCRWPDGLKKEILEALVQGSKGMFRWAVCQIDILQRKRREYDIRKALKELPETLDETYERIFNEITGEDWPIARSALLWICAHDDLPFKINMPSHCLVSAIFYGTPGAHFCNLDALQEICGCLINVALVESATTVRIQTVSLAHYTVREYLYSYRIPNTSVSFFSLDVSTTLQESLKTVLQVAATTNPTALSWAFWASFESYCYLVAWMSPRLRESYIAANFILRDSLLELFWRNPSSLHFNSSPILARWYNDADYYEFFDTKPFNNIEPTQWLTLPNDNNNKAPLILGSLLAHRLYYVVDTFASGRNTLELLLHPLLIRRPQQDGIKKDLLHTTNILEATVQERQLSIPRIHLDATKFIPYCLVLHCHEKICSEECIIKWLIGEGIPVSPPGLRLTSLQLAVHRWDLPGVHHLLRGGANVNEVGDPIGEILPNTETAFSAYSPLHILRTGAYGLQHIEEYAQLRESREQGRGVIEALLLESGALDFVADDHQEVA